MPETWENLRKCDFYYEFSGNVIGLENNLFNYTRNIYNIYKILYQSAQKYYIEQ